MVKVLCAGLGRRRLLVQAESVFAVTWGSLGLDLGLVVVSVIDACATGHLWD